MRTVHATLMATGVAVMLALVGATAQATPARWAGEGAHVGIESDHILTTPPPMGSRTRRRPL